MKRILPLAALAAVLLAAPTVRADIPELRGPALAASPIDAIHAVDREELALVDATVLGHAGPAFSVPSVFADAAVTAPSSSSVGAALLAFILAHLTEGTILAVLGYIGGRFLSRDRERQVATAIFYAAHMAADIDIELAPGGAKSTADKIAAYLKAADDYCLSHGWRALKPGEQLAAATKAQAIVGAGKIAAGGDVPALDPSKAPAAA
jgi:hypothetical protein